MPKLEHIAVSANTERDSDRFFVELLGLDKTRAFSITAESAQKFFGVERELRIVRYTNGRLDVEVIVTQDDSRAKDLFTHACLVVEDRDTLERRARSLGLRVIHVPKTGSDTYYLFIKDFFGNLYEIK
ncbi:MAG: VOC family protein [Deltaproteobacteria bacterium]|nr:VOC family protein [Deltaproteobacteria bacterium]